MSKNKVLLYIVIYAMLTGGIMGIIKGVVPNMTWLSFRSLLGLGDSLKNNNIPTYEVIYGIIMAALEIVSAILLLGKVRIGIGIRAALITLSINALGCIIAISFGDMFAIGSLLTRIFAIYILAKQSQLLCNEI